MSTFAATAIWTVDVWYATSRPPTDQQMVRIRLAHPEDDPIGANLTALMWVAASPGVVMPTRSQIVDLEL